MLLETAPSKTESQGVFDPQVLAVQTSMRPIVRELPADLETPVSVYLKLADMGPSFLLESVTGGEQLARYSFIGVHPSRAFLFRGREVEIRNLRRAGEISRYRLEKDRDPLDVIGEMLAAQTYRSGADLPRFSGGLVGYMGYELMRFFEPSLELRPHPDFPDALFLMADIVVAFDHAFGRVLLIGNVRAEEDDRSARQEIESRLDEIQARLAAPLPACEAPSPSTSHPMTSNMSEDAFCQAVRTAKEHITAGDIFQVVLSQRMSRETQAAPFEIYRALRRLNPSPYMFYFDFVDLVGDEPLRLIGASPELHVRLEGRTAAVRPIAGTRKRGRTPEEQTALEKELLADPKERAEHVMLVDLGRNDLGRICRYGSVEVTEQMVVERYSHVIHLVSHVQGELRPEFDAVDLLRATFPAGTVSGAPKIRAMQIIDRLEPEPRGPYAGAVGYFSYDGSMDTCIAIRTMVMQGEQVYLQAGAGIVADSVPENEYQETLNKLRALGAAIDIAEGKEVKS